MREEQGKLADGAQEGGYFLMGWGLWRGGWNKANGRGMYGCMGVWMYGCNDVSEKARQLEKQAGRRRLKMERRRRKRKRGEVYCTDTDTDTKQVGYGG